jgi:prepilin-type processing-associated H-X9-DG protein
MMPMAEGDEFERIREPVQAMIRSLQWAAAGLDLPPQTRLRLVVQAGDSSGAREVLSAIRKVCDLGMEKAAERGEDQKQLVRVLTQTLLPPEPQGDKLVQTIAGEQVAKILTQVRPPLALARVQARKSFSANNVGQFGRALHIYWGTKNQWPDDLRQMMEVSMQRPYDESDDVLVNPQRPKMRPAYVYRKPGVPISKVSNPGAMIFLYERYDEWGDGINVGFLDGHVTFIRDQAEFEQMLARTIAMDPGGSVTAVPTTQKAGGQ